MEEKPGKAAVDVSVIIPVYNGEEYLDECLSSIFHQDLTLAGHACSESSNEALVVELSIFNDGSTDSTRTIIENWKVKFQSKSIEVVTTDNPTGTPRGVGYAKNRAVEMSTGTYLCFCDADDIMEPTRIRDQYEAAIQVSHQNTIIGSKFKKLPEGSTHIFSRWANTLTQDQLHTQIFQSFGPTLVMPTWFCHRLCFLNVHGGFSENGKGTPEDLIFFYEHLKRGGRLARVDRVLMAYRYSSSSATFSVKESTIWDLRFNHFVEQVLSKPDWLSFSIYGAGKLGRRFYRSLPPKLQLNVIAFADIDEKKIGQSYRPHPNPLQVAVPIISVENLNPPCVACVKTEYFWDTESPFRFWIARRNLIEGRDFFLFS